MRKMNIYLLLQILNCYHHSLCKSSICVWLTIAWIILFETIWPLDLASRLYYQVPSGMWCSLFHYCCESIFLFPSLGSLFCLQWWTQPGCNDMLYGIGERYATMQYNIYIRPIFSKEERIEIQISIINFMWLSICHVTKNGSNMSIILHWRILC